MSLLVVAYAAVSLMFGNRASPEVWAFLLAAPETRWAAVLSVGLLLMGLTVGTGRHARLRQLTDERQE